MCARERVILLHQTCSRAVRLLYKAVSKITKCKGRPTGYDWNTHAQDCDGIDVGSINQSWLSVVLAKTLANITTMGRLISGVKQNNRWNLDVLQVESRYLSQINICLSRRLVLLSRRKQLAGLGWNQSVSYRMQSLVPVFFSHTRLSNLTAENLHRLISGKKKIHYPLERHSKIFSSLVEWHNNMVWVSNYKWSNATRAAAHI